MTLLEELKRRKVFRVAAVYVIVSWLLLQVADVLLENFAAPDWIFRVLVVVLVIGFPLALVLAWLFELQLDRGAQDSEGRGAASTVPASMRLVLGGFLVVIVILLVERIWYGATHAGAGSVAEGGEATVATETSREDRSIAVLPFENFSAAAEDAFFADGLADTVLHRLARLEDLTVIARNSSFVYKGSNVDVRKVGADLGVANVLEGSVQRQGDRLRVIAQLVETTGGAHLWSQTYDRPMDDIFSIQDQIALSVAEALQVELLGKAEESLTRAGTDNPQALAAYLRARELWNDASADGADTLAEITTALALDAGYVEAWAFLAHYYDVEAFTAQSEADRAAAIERGLRVAEHALTLDPESPDALLSLASLRRRQGDTQEALAISLRLLEDSPGDAELLSHVGLSFWDLGKPDRALQFFERAHVVDPLAPMNFRQRGLANVSAGNVGAGAGILEESVARWPDFGLFVVDLGLVRGRAEGRWDLAISLWGDYVERRGAARAASVASVIASAHALLGSAEAAARWADVVAESGTPLDAATTRFPIDVAAGQHQQIRDELLTLIPTAQASVHLTWACFLAEVRDALTPACALDTARRLVPGIEQQLADVVPFRPTPFDMEQLATRGLVELRLGDAELGAALLEVTLERLADLDWEAGDLCRACRRPIAEAELLAALGRGDAALDSLERALASLPEATGAVFLGGIVPWVGPEHSPFFDTLRGQPRFEEAIAAMATRAAAQVQAI